jgi:hypothetical protein
MKEQALSLILEIKEFIDKNSEHKNEQWFLDFLDELNEISVSY